MDWNHRKKCIVSELRPQRARWDDGQLEVWAVERQESQSNQREKTEWNVVEEDVRLQEGDRKHHLSQEASCSFCWGLEMHDRRGRGRWRRSIWLQWSTWSLKERRVNPSISTLKVTGLWVEPLPAWLLSGFFFFCAMLVSVHLSAQWRDLLWGVDGVNF
jgi:hypothetical protein